MSKMTIYKMVIDIARCLQVGVTDRGAEEFETAFFHGFGNGIRERGRGWNFGECLPIINDRLAAGQKRTQVGAKRAELALHLDKPLCI